MESERKRAAGEKLKRKACAWIECKKSNSKSVREGLDDAGKRAAQHRYSTAENELTEAAEKYQKEN